MVYQTVLKEYIHKLLNVERFKDYSPNGLQVQGKIQISKIVTGVSASLELIKSAISKNADAILVHHGYFWKGETQTITGVKYKRIHSLIKHNINLFSYHLPLDIHPELGNNVQLAKLLDLEVVRKFSTDTIPNCGLICHKKISLSDLISKIETVLRRTPLVVGNTKEKISNIAICTGSAQNFIEYAYQENADVYISGEISENTTLLARELDITYIAAGHHATERYGIQTLGEHLAQVFDLEHDFIDIDNPV
jgi:dinuclear metal center YbgI/SA1388 family protein